MIRLAQAIQNLVYPPRCPFCDGVLGLQLECDQCAQQCKNLVRPRFRLDEADHFLKKLNGAASVYFYRDEIRQAILRMKYGGRAAYGDVLGRIMAQHLFGCTFQWRGGIITAEYAPPVGLEYDIVVPVPSSNGNRGFNPPQRIAQPLAQALNLPLNVQLLKKIRTTPRQEGLSREKRMNNLVGAFWADPQQIPPNGRVLLVDDVITTGATVAACADALKKAGAETVFALSVAVSE